MKKITQITRLKDTLNKIALLTKSSNTELHRRPESTKSYDYTDFIKGAVNVDFVRIYTPFINVEPTHTFAIVVNDELLSATIKKFDSNDMKTTIPMEFDQFRDILKSFLKDISTNPSLWVTAFHDNFLTPELDNSERTKAKMKAFAIKQRDLIKEYRSLTATEKENQNLISCALDEAEKMTLETKEHSDVIKLKEKLAEAEKALHNKRTLIQSSLDIPAMQLDDQKIKSQLQDLNSKISWSFERKQSDDN